MRNSRIANGENIYTQWGNASIADSAGSAQLQAHQQLGAIALPTNPTNTQTLTLTINGTAITVTFVSSIGSTAGNVLIAGTAALTAANLIGLLTNPGVTSSTQVALAANNQTLANYIDWHLVGTTITPCSLNSTNQASLTTFTASTTVTGGSYTAQTLELFVEPGVVYVNGTRVIFAGGSTPLVTAPVSNPRIDVLTIDSSGTLAWTTGAENASPTAPAYPINKMPICELYNVTSETVLVDNANQSSGKGYILNDVRPFLSFVPTWSAFGADIIPDADGTRNLGSLSYEWNNIYAKSGVYLNGQLTAFAKFGGTGADGALSISSGTTTINAGGARILIKNYTSISITGTGKLAFSNPHVNGTIIILKSQGNVTLTSSTVPCIDASGMGAAGGNAVTANSSSSNGNTGTASASLIMNIGAGLAGVNSGTPPAVGSSSFALSSTLLAASNYLKYQFVAPGAGGGSGSASSIDGVLWTSGVGGTGGGALVIECGSALNFTGTISVAGITGGNSSSGGGASRGYAQGGSGGAAGSFLMLYNALTTNSGSVTITPGSPGTGSVIPGASTSTNSGPSGAASAVANGSASTASGINSVSAPGASASGFSSIFLNTEFA